MSKDNIDNIDYINLIKLEFGIIVKGRYLQYESQPFNTEPSSVTSYDDPSLLPSSLESLICKDCLETKKDEKMLYKQIKKRNGLH